MIEKKRQLKFLAVVLLVAALFALARCEVRTSQHVSQNESQEPSLSSAVEFLEKPNEFQVRVRWRGQGNRPLIIERREIRKWDENRPFVEVFRSRSEDREFIDTAVRALSQYQYRIVEPVTKQVSSPTTISVHADVIATDKDALASSFHTLHLNRLFIPPGKTWEVPTGYPIAADEIVAGENSEIRLLPVKHPNQDGYLCYPLSLRARRVVGKLRVTGEIHECNYGPKKLKGPGLYFWSDSPTDIDLPERWVSEMGDAASLLCIRIGDKKAPWVGECATNLFSVKDPFTDHTTTMPQDPAHPDPFF